MINLEELKRIWDQYRDHLYHFVLAKVSDEETARDIVQDVAVKLLQANERSDEIRNFQAWLFQVTRNTIADYFRRMASERKYSQMIDQEEVEREAMLCACDFIEPLIRKCLPEENALPLLLSDIEGIPQKEVADRLGLSLGAVKSRIQRGRKKLKMCVMDCVDVEYNLRGEVTDYFLKPFCQPTPELKKLLTARVKI